MRNPIEGLTNKMTEKKRVYRKENGIEDGVISCKALQ